MDSLARLSYFLRFSHHAPSRFTRVPSKKLCDRHERFLVISHVRPDGDAYGSTLGLALSLRAMRNDVQVVNADGLSPLFEFLPASKGLTATPPGAPEPDRLIIAVDCGGREAARRGFRPMAARPRRQYRSSPQQSRLCEIEPDRSRLARHGPGPPRKSSPR